MELEKTLSKIPLIQELDDLKNQVDELRPFSDEAQNRIMQKFRLDWNYHSNAIEGNPYTYGETVAFIMHGITAKGKKLKDHLDIKGHDETILYLLDMVKGDRNFTENDIRELHKMILKEPYSSDAITPLGQKVQKQIKLGEYKGTPNHVITKTGEMHYYATPEETPLKMADLMKWYSEAYENKEIHPLVLASLFHHKFVAIHPFDDGNGRLGRILMNFILMKKSYPPIVVKQEDRENYYSVLSQADVGENLPLVEYLGEGLKRSLEIQLRGARGEDISEVSDLNKEIALLKGSFAEKDVVSIKKDLNIVLKTLNESILPLIKEIHFQCKKFDELFIESKMNMDYSRSPSEYEEDGISLAMIMEEDPGYFDVEPIFVKNNQFQILESNKMIDNFDFQYDLLDFKKNESPFNVIVKVYVFFSKFKYRLYYYKDGNKKAITHEKYYGEIFTGQEKKAIIYELIKTQIIDQIKLKTQK